jgi:hypothetical protein
MKFQKGAANPKSRTIGQHILIRRNIQNQHDMFALLKQDIATMILHSFSYEKI